MKRLDVLYDAECGVCSRIKAWLLAQPKTIALCFIPAASPQAARMFPSLVTLVDPGEFVVVNDEGGVYFGNRAWIMCLYALRDYRAWSRRLAHPLMLPVAREAFHMLSNNRATLSRWLGLEGEAATARRLREQTTIVATAATCARPSQTPPPQPT